MQKKNFFKISGLAALLLLPLIASSAGSIPFSEDFSTFAGAGFAPTPTTGQLDSDIWRVTGMSEGNGTFGGTYTTGDFARGSDAEGGVSSGGVYAFTTGGNTLFGVQPAGSDFTPGTITLQLVNGTGSTITDLSVAYDIVYNNDQDRGNSLNFAYSTDDSTYTSVSSLNFTTPETKGTGFQSESKSITLTGLNIANGSMLYLQWQSDDINGSGSRDELGIDNIEVTVDGGSSGTTLAIQATDADKAEGNSGTTVFTFTVTRSGDTSGATAVDYAITGDADVADFGGTLPAGTVSFAAGETTQTITLNVTGDTDAELDETFTVTLSNATGGATITTDTATGTIQNDDGVAITRIHEIQGTTDISPLRGQNVTIRGIVVADFQDDLGSSRIRGFYVQEEDLDADAEPLTSEGIFVFCSTCATPVNVGDDVTITGDVSEFQNQTQLGGTLTITVNASAVPLPTASSVILPALDANYFERFEGMLVTFPQELFVTELFQLGRFGQVTLSSGDRLAQPTNVAMPGVDANALQAENNLNRIILDDFTNGQNPDPIIFGRSGNELTASNTLRGGDSVVGLTGVLVYSWGGNRASPNAYRVRVRQSPLFVANNPRPTQAPDTGNANLKIATFNVLNYFNTFTDGTLGGCYLADTFSANNCRGADNANEFTRQSDKTVSAIQKLNADILALNEIENDGFGADSAIQDLVNKVNAVMGAGTYAFVDPGVSRVGRDAITVGFLYKPAAIEVLNVALLESGEFDPVNAARHRVPMAVNFKHKASGQEFVAAAIHFKSKGSLTSVPEDADQLDGQGNNNFSRTKAAKELRAWLATNPTTSNSNRIMVLGDFNAYAMEDPLREFTSNGFVNVIDGYSYVFNGQWGSLDHIVVNDAFAANFVKGGKYHVNADEPSVLDYNTNFKSANQVTALYAADEFRNSDHDPVLAGFSLLVGDIDGNGVLNQSDLTALISVYGLTSTRPDWNPAADLNGDGKINALDYRLLRIELAK